MSSDTPMNTPPAVQKEASTPAIIPTQQSLSPFEVERICRAFIRLITAPEVHNDNPTNPKPR